ncbi:MAG: hypothetical protein H0U66_04715 [Gemmatimonadaceae bacterium]|nr:hypothetical protein [Gemmatimonadaceae bacterium]
MKTTRLRALSSVAVAASLTVFACGKSGSDPGSKDAAQSGVGAKATGSVIGLTYAPEVATMERKDGLGALKGINSNGDLFLFAKDNSTIASLKPGSVLLIKSLMAKKVLAIRRSPKALTAVRSPTISSWRVRFGSSRCRGGAIDRDQQDIYGEGMDRRGHGHAGERPDQAAREGVTDGERLQRHDHRRWLPAELRRRR